MTDKSDYEVSTDAAPYGYARVAFYVEWYEQGAREFAGEFEIKGMSDQEIAELLHFSSPKELRPDGKVIGSMGFCVMVVRSAMLS